MRRTVVLAIWITVGTLIGVLVAGYGVRQTSYAPTWLRAKLKPPRETGEIVFLTLRGPTTTEEKSVAGKGKDERQTGFEHDLASLFARELGAVPKFVVLPSYTELLRAMREGRGHIAAAGLTSTPELRQEFAFGPSYKSVQYQLVYRTNSARPKTMRDAIGKRVSVIAETPAHDLVRSLSGDFPGMALDVLVHESTPDDLLKRIDGGGAGGAANVDIDVNKESATSDFAIVDANAFAIGKRLHPDLAKAFNVDVEQRVAWAFSSAADYDLQQSVVAFFDKIRGNGTLARLLDRYYGHTNRIQPLDAEAIIDKIQSELPKLRKFFHEAQNATGIDWRMLAAVGYQESHWDPLATSPTGVRGLMMLTDETADRMKVKNRLDARESIIGGAKYLLTLRDTIPDRIAEPDRTWLALAAYNQGYGHLEDARILAARMKLNPDSWLDVRKVYPRLREPEHHEKLKYGFARGDEAVQFVENIRNYVDILTKLEKPLELDATFEARQEDIELIPPSKRKQALQTSSKVSPSK
jgi:membrane-bound lytic murein transglycosylase F